MCEKCETRTGCGSNAAKNPAMPAFVEVKSVHDLKYAKVEPRRVTLTEELNDIYDKVDRHESELERLTGRFDGTCGATANQEAPTHINAVVDGIRGKLERIYKMTEELKERIG